MRRKWKRTLGAYLLALALALSLLPAAAWAAEGGAGLPEQSTAQTLNDGEGTTEGTTEGGNSGADDGGTDKFPAGDGSKDAPYQIDTAEKLLWFAGLVNGTPEGGDSTSEEGADTDAWAELTEDIDLSRVCGEDSSWTPIGSNSDNAYTGTFDGQGHTIEGLYIDSSETYAGLFGVVGMGGVIQNLTVDEGFVTGSNNVGGVCGYNDQGTIQNCLNTGDITATGTDGKAGGICGSNNGGPLANCLNTGAVTATGSGSYAGASAATTATKAKVPPTPASPPAPSRTA